MGRWDEGQKPKSNRNFPKLIKKIIYLGFIVIDYNNIISIYTKAWSRI